MHQASRQKGREMFTEKGLLQKARGMKEICQPSSNYQQLCYCKKNAVFHKRDTVFDAARRDRLASNYFGNPSERDNCLLEHTKSPEQARLMRTYNTVSQNLAVMEELGNRNWSHADLPPDKPKPGTAFPKPRTAQASVGSRKPLSASAPRLPETLPHQPAERSIQTAASRTTQMVRVFSPGDRMYVERSALLENESQRLSYLSMRSANNVHSVNVCGRPCPTAPGQPFEASTAKHAKPYTVSAETFNGSWVDRARPQTTTNYESSKFNIINHANGQNGSITQYLQLNPRACYKVKSIAEICDLARVSAPKPNPDYHLKLRSHPTCFLKAASLCAQQCDNRRTYGPHVKLFK